ncbi:MAG: DUF222 domain-containing protein, partial [Acidimicrobiales bacterium]
ALYTAVDAAARRHQKATPDDKRTLDQLRADVLAGLGWSALHAGHLGCCHPSCAHMHQRLGSRRGRPATINVTVAYTTLIGVDDQPAHLEGYGPIGAEVARRIAAHGTWRRVLTDPATGAVLDVGRERYLPPPELAEHVIVRDQSCRFPTCAHPAEACDLDHTTPFEQGGATAAGESGTGAPRAPHRQDPPRLAAATARTRTIRVDRTHRAHLRGRPRNRRTPRAATATGRGPASRADTPRPRPTTLLTRGSGNVTGSRG